MLTKLGGELGQKPLDVGALAITRRGGGELQNCAFAVHRLTMWAEEGVDIHAKLPMLSAYLGHQNLLGTEVYLKATPQLLELASTRFEQHLRCARQPR